MPFQNPIVGGTALVRAAIKSPNYAPGVSGWSINRDGTAEFSGTTIRGNIIVVGSGGSVELTLLAGNPTMYFYNPTKTNWSYINAVSDATRAKLGINGDTHVSTVISGAPPPSVRPRLYFDDFVHLGYGLTAGYVGGTVQFNEVSWFMSLYDKNAAIVGGISIGNTDGVSNPLMIMGVKSAALVQGPQFWFDKDTVQFKTNLNDPNPVQYQRVSRWMGVAGADWTAMPLSNGWVQLSGYSTAAVKLEVDGRAVMKGNIQSGISADGTIIATLPSSLFYPAGGLQVKVHPTTEGGGAADGRFIITATGFVVLFGAAGTTQIGVDGLSWYVDHP